MVTGPEVFPGILAMMENCVQEWVKAETVMSERLAAS